MSSSKEASPSIFAPIGSTGFNIRQETDDGETERTEVVRRRPDARNDSFNEGIHGRRNVLTELEDHTDLAARSPTKRRAVANLISTFSGSSSSKAAGVRSESHRHLLDAAQILSDDPQLLGAFLGPRWTIAHEKMQAGKVRAQSWWLKYRWLFKRGASRVAPDDSKSSSDTTAPTDAYLLDLLLPGDDDEPPSRRIQPSSPATKAQARADILAVDKAKARENMRNRARARQAAVQQAKDRYRESSAARPSVQEERSQARADIQAVDKAQALANMKEKGRVRQKAIEQAKKEYRDRQTYKMARGVGSPIAF